MATALVTIQGLPLPPTRDVAGFTPRNFQQITAEPRMSPAVSLRMPRKRNRRYSIDIKDAKGVCIFFAAAGWSDEERRAAVTQILRLDGVPEVHDDFNKSSSSANHDEE